MTNPNTAANGQPLRPVRPVRHEPVRTRATRADHARLAAKLTDRDRWILRILNEHRVLTTTQLTALAFPSPRAAQLRLKTLYQLGVIDRFQPLTPIGSAPLHWVLDAPGTTVLDAEHPTHVDIPPARRRGGRRTSALAVAHSNQLRHLLGVNTCLTDLATHTTPPGGLSVWWSETRCARHLGDFIRPDAYAHWTHTTPTGRTTVLAFFFEYDLGSESTRQLAAKLTGYHQLAAAEHITTPVLFWFPTAHREHTARTALTTALDGLAQPHLVPVATTHSPPRLETAPRAVSGLAGAVWQPLSPALAATPSPHDRVGLDDLAGFWPAPAHHHANTARSRHDTTEPPAPHPTPPPPAAHPAHQR